MAKKKAKKKVAAKPKAIPCPGDIGDLIGALGDAMATITQAKKLKIDSLPADHVKKIHGQMDRQVAAIKRMCDSMHKSGKTAVAKAKRTADKKARLEAKIKALEAQLAEA